MQLTIRSRHAFAAHSADRSYLRRFMIRWKGFWLVLVALLGLILYHRWLTTVPLTSGDWPWVPTDQMRSWFPLPSVWWPEMGFGLKNFSGLYEAPIETVAGVLAWAGLDWGFVEKVLYFVPFAILSFVSPWFLAREILGSARWAVVSALLFASSTYFLTFSVGGQMFLAVAQAIAPMIAYSLIRSVRLSSVRWAIWTGLLLGIQAAYEVRITYLTLGLLAGYLVIIAATSVKIAALRRAGGLFIVAGAVFVGTQAYWVLPLITYHGNRGLPLASEPWLAFMRLGNGITGLAPYWTGRTPAIFHETAVQPWFFLFPLLAFCCLIIRPIRAEVLWLSASALVAAFLIKQTNPPLGGVYAWMFFHLPGWNLFREASKLYFIVALSYSILVPIAIRALFMAAARTRHRLKQTAISALAIAALLTVTIVAAAGFVPLETGELRYTSYPSPQPESFRSLGEILARDPNYGAVLWLGGPWIFDEFGVDHSFPLRSTRHPVVELLGTSDASDPLVAFCRVPTVPFCYLDKELLPYLMSRTGATYVVAPAGPGVGRLPSLATSVEPTLTADAIGKQVTDALGPPRILDPSTKPLAVWSLPSAQPVLAGKGLAIIEGSPAITEQALQAVKGLGVPAVYSAQVPPDQHQLPLSIDVVPGLEGSYHVSNPGGYIILAQGSLSLLSVTIDGMPQPLSLVTDARKAPGWSAYGPVLLPAGEHRVVAATNNLGPAIAWSPLAASLLGGQYPPERGGGTLSAEQVVLRHDLGAPSWIELRRTYDTGWQAAGTSYHLLGDGLFNVYYASNSSSPTTFEFATLGWEISGALLSIAWGTVALVLGLIFGSRVILASPKSVLGRPPDGRQRMLRSVAALVALAGVTFLGVASYFQWLDWAGIPSKAPSMIRWFGLVGGSDPYGQVEGNVAAGMALLAVAIVIHLAAIRGVMDEHRPNL